MSTIGCASCEYPNISVEQMNVYHMHGYTAAWVLPVGIQPEGLEIKVQPKHRYAAVHVEKPFENPFVTIPSAYQTLDSFMRVNGLVHTESGVIPCYETNGEAWTSILRVSKTVWGIGIRQHNCFFKSNPLY